MSPLKGHNAFRNVMDEGVKMKTKDALGCFLFTNQKTSEHIIKFGVTVSKRNAKKAVVRNRIRRLLRESLIRISKQSPEMLSNIDKFVIIWKTAPSHPGMIKLKDIEPTVKLLFEKANSEKQRLS